MVAAVQVVGLWLHGALSQGCSNERQPGVASGQGDAPSVERPAVLELGEMGTPGYLSGDTVWLRLVVPESVLHAQDIPLVVSITPTWREVRLSFRGRFASARFMILDGERREIWSTPGTATSSVTSVLNIPPGDTARLSQTWYQRGRSGQLVPNGSYEVWAEPLLHGVEVRLGPALMTIGRH